MPNEYGITAKEATEALTAAMRLLPPPCDYYHRQGKRI